MQHRLRIGTRGSPLALWQAEAVRDALIAAHPALDADGVDIVVIRTTGDRIIDRPLVELGGKGLFTREIEAALHAGRIDCAVHSAKDMPTELPPGLVLGACLERADPRDALISRTGGGLDNLPTGAVIGTASLRRRAQCLARRPDLRIVPLRGNVGTRLDKLSRREVDATLLALAGLTRLGRADAASAVLSLDEMLPAPAQGAIAIECRADDVAMRTLLDGVDVAATHIAITAERAFLAALEGSCRTPIAAFAEIAGRTLHLRGRILTPDGSACHQIAREGPAAEAAALGTAAGAALRREVGDAFLERIRAEA
ncbi:MAG: hydroxymethylbilane synthase [Rhodothalassiaceae bacterium]